MEGILLVIFLSAIGKSKVQSGLVHASQKHDSKDRYVRKADSEKTHPGAVDAGKQAVSSSGAASCAVRYAESAPPRSSAELHFAASCFTGALGYCRTFSPIPSAKVGWG